MARNPKPKPSFFKVLLGDFTHRLRLPPQFVKNHGEILPENVTLKTNSGKSWNVKLEQDDGGLYFTRGWGKFLEDLDLKMGTFLVFRLADNSTVNVFAYGLSACEMEFEDGESQTDDSEPEEVPLGLSAHNAKGKQPVYTGTTNLNFCVTLQEHHRYRLPLNKGFVTEAKLAYKNAVVLKRGSSCWPVALHRPKTGGFKLSMSTGWSEFREANGLAFGDKCLFEFIPHENVISVGVITDHE